MSQTHSLLSHTGRANLRQDYIENSCRNTAELMVSAYERVESIVVKGENDQQREKNESCHMIIINLRAEIGRDQPRTKAPIAKSCAPLKEL